MLSGGQKQRLTIAQVILRKPKIVLFDEATSALDHNSEAKIRKSIQELSETSIVIVITHRFASIVDADRIVVMREGEIVDTGTHEELSEKCR